MNKGLKITLIILGVMVGIIVLDTLQALLFDNSPVIKIRENINGGSTYYIDKGLFVNHYYCANKEENTVFKNVKYSCPIIENEELTDNLDKELLNCLESQLGGYLVTETDNLIELPLNEIKSSNKEKIAYYKGVYASNHPNNVFIMVYPENGTYESSVMKDFDKYFYNKFSVYQKYESPLRKSSLNSFASLLKRGLICGRRDSLYKAETVGESEFLNSLKSFGLKAKLVFPIFHNFS